jgi:DNA/RNA endonuclease YhcR with UshA esterase domain
MRQTFFAIFVAGLVTLGVGTPAWAHHSFAAAYDLTKPVTVHGVITNVRLQNPHSWFFLEAKDESGKTVKWAFEAGTPSGMIRNGYKPSIIKPGAEVTIKGFHARDAAQNMGMLRELITADGQTFGMFGPQEGPGK